MKANKRKKVTVVYMGRHKFTGRVLAVDERTVLFKIDQPGCRAMLLDKDKVEVASA